jgi:phosphoribosylformylglycinamidine cyclo-ligase
MTQQEGLTYAESGVDYGSIDPAKIMAQKAAAATSGQLGKWGMTELSASRGESAYVWEEPDADRAFVVEGLGTKNLVADATRPITGRTHYDALAQDTVAMIVNDVIVVGAEPQVVNAYWAIGDSNWFEDRVRAKDLVDGWAAACEKAGATWGGGETPCLTGIIQPGTIDLGGACVGMVSPKERLTLGDKLQAGDAVVLLASSGIHANGLTLARSIADRLPEGYATDIGDGTGYGEALLSPTHLYARLVADIFEAGADVHYLANITGHGWRKIMRVQRELRYRMHTLPTITPLFSFLMERGGLDNREAYGNLNMGAGFAIYLPESDAQKVLDVAANHGIEAMVAGRVEEGPREVILEPIDVTYEGKSLGVRG